MSTKKTIPCPCNSKKTLANCCAPYHEGHLAPTAEILMRSRYTAFVLGLSEYVWQTWHPDTRPDLDILGGLNLKWINLEILAADAELENDNKGKVHFVASYVTSQKGKKLDENSAFVKEDGVWLYVDGDCTVTDISRNDICPCGSRQKFKRCCLKAS